MPRPSNITQLFDELLYEPKVLQESNWQIHNSKESLTIRTSISHPLYGRIAYSLKSNGPGTIWLRLSQYYPKKNIKDQEIINIPLNWLPDGYREDFELILTQCLFTEPTSVIEINNEKTPETPPLNS